MGFAKLAQVLNPGFQEVGIRKRRETGSWGSPILSLILDPDRPIEIIESSTGDGYGMFLTSWVASLILLHSL